MAIPLVVSEYSQSVDYFFTAYPWALFICFAPFILLTLAFCVATVTLILQYLFEEYHKQREQGLTPDEAFRTRMVAIVILFGLLFLSYITNNSLNR